MNKKAEMNWFIMTLVIVTIILVLYFLVLGKTPIDTITETGESVTIDSDGDDFVNSLDPCPCGSPPNQKNKKIPISGYEYCLSGFTVDQCNQIIEQKNFTGFSVKEYRGENVCVYKKESKMNKECPILS